MKRTSRLLLTNNSSEERTTSLSKPWLIGMSSPWSKMTSITETRINPNYFFGYFWKRAWQLRTSIHLHRLDNYFARVIFKTMEPLQLLHLFLIRWESPREEALLRAVSGELGQSIVFRAVLKLFPLTNVIPEVAGHVWGKHPPKAIHDLKWQANLAGLSIPWSFTGNSPLCWDTGQTRSIQSRVLASTIVCLSCLRCSCSR